MLQPVEVQDPRNYCPKYSVFADKRTKRCVQCNPDSRNATCLWEHSVAKHATIMARTLTRYEATVNYSSLSRQSNIVAFVRVNTINFFIAVVHRQCFILCAFWL